MSMTQSSSSSTSFLMNNPQTDWLTQVSKYAQQQAQNMLGWAQQTYNTVSGYTDQAIHGLVQNAQQASNGASNLWNRYQQTFQPLENQLVSDANTYASGARTAMDMGQAEAGQQQAGNQGRIAAEQNLRSYGIDPSSGRFADLEMANRAATAAAAAGAGQQARLNTEATGRQLRSQAIQVGQQLPGQTANFLNSGTSSLATAANAGNALANTGANLMNLPNQYLGTAMGLRPPPTGQSSGSGSKSQTAPRPPTTPTDRSQSDQQAGAPNYGPMGTQQGGGTPGFDPYNGPASPSPVNGTQFDGYTAQNNYAFGGQSDPILASQYGGFDTGYNAATGTDIAGSQGYTGLDPAGSYAPYDPANLTGASTGWDSGLNNTYQGVDNAWGAQAPMDNSGGFTDPLSGYNMGDAGTSSYDTASYDSGGGGDYSGDYSETAATGGPIGDSSGIDDGDQAPYQGSMVPPQASPSNGAIQDDVKASLTPHEFVVPQDVALWKGQEFFQNLIKKSREARMQAPGKPTPQPTLPGPTRFQSQG